MWCCDTYSGEEAFCKVTTMFPTSFKSHNEVVFKTETLFLRSAAIVILNSFVTYFKSSGALACASKFLTLRCCCTSKLFNASLS